MRLKNDVWAWVRTTWPGIPLCALFLFSGARVEAMRVTCAIQGYPNSSTTTIHVGSITGPLGHIAESDDPNATPAESHTEGESGTTGFQEGTFGYWCKGITCTGQQPEITQPNYLMVQFQRQNLGYDEEGHPIADDHTYSVNATVYCSDKISREDTLDYNCPQGPPAWTAIASVTASEPVKNVTLNSPSAFQGVPLAGSASDTWQHTPGTPGGPPGNTVWNHSSPNAGFGDESRDYPLTDWVYDPNNGASNMITVSCEVLSKFQGGAVEIDVKKSSLRVNVRLTVTVQ